MKIDKNYCMSSFLQYRRIVDRECAFSSTAVPRMIEVTQGSHPIHDSYELEAHLKKVVTDATKNGEAVLALSGGIDSAILARFMPKGSTALTFRCTAGELPTVDETKKAAYYAETCGLKHEVVEITWKDMELYAPILMRHKHAPIHSIEVQIYAGGVIAKKLGFKKVIYGETADVKYGGLSNILSRDWTVGEFIERYAYLKPWYALKAPIVDFSCVLPYSRVDGTIDVHRYVSEFDIVESVNSYVNACECADVEFIAPFADTYLACDLDLARVRRGENKYLIREIFERLYPCTKVPDKIPMPRATDQWLKNWKGPQRYEFIPNCTKGMNGDQKWLLWALETYLNIDDIE